MVVVIGPDQFQEEIGHLPHLLQIAAPVVGGEGTACRVGPLDGGVGQPGGPQRDHHAGGEDRIDEPGGISHQQPPLPRHHLMTVGVIAGGVELAHPFRFVQPVAEFGAARHRLLERLLGRQAGGLEGVEPLHQPDGSLFAVERDEPEPGLLQPDDGDVAAGGPFVAEHSMEMGEGGEPLGHSQVGLGQPELAAQEGVPPAGVDDPAGLGGSAFPLVAIGQPMRGPAFPDFDLFHLGLLAHLAARIGGMPEK